MFEDLDQDQKALLYDALNSKLNAIDKLTQQACANDDEPDNAQAQIFRKQYETVYNMVEAVYPEGN